MRCVADRIFGKTDESCFSVAAAGSSGTTFDPYSGSSTNVPQFQPNTQQRTGNSPNGVGVWTENL